ncbi:hypothetical protein N7536_003277 [Penicillium majusculum]|nr:hypothetical protein N7536_003277 [Penicillium majusculum]
MGVLNLVDRCGKQFLSELVEMCLRRLRHDNTLKGERFVPGARYNYVVTGSSFSLIERVILSAGAMLIFSVYFHLTICPEGQQIYGSVQYNLTFRQNYTA